MSRRNEQFSSYCIPPSDESIFWCKLNQKEQKSGKNIVPGRKYRKSQTEAVYNFLILNESFQLFISSLICLFVRSLFMGHNLLILCSCSTTSIDNEPAVRCTNNLIAREPQSKCYQIDWWCCPYYCCLMERIVQLLKFKFVNLIQIINAMTE